MATAGRNRPGDNGGAPGSAACLPSHHPSHHPTRQPSRWRRNLALVVALAGAASLAWAWRDLREEALVGAAYGARVGCVCRFVSNRPLESCKADLRVAGLGGAASMVSLSQDEASRSVTASVPLLASQSATFAPERGCSLEPWRR